MCTDMFIQWNETNERTEWSFHIHRKINQVSHTKAETKGAGKNCFENESARITVEQEGK